MLQRLRRKRPIRFYGPQADPEQVYAIALLLYAAKLPSISARGIHHTARLWKAIESSKALQKILRYPVMPPAMVVHQSLRALKKQGVLEEKDTFPRNYYEVHFTKLEVFVRTKTNCTLPNETIKEIRAAAKKIPAHD